MEERIDGGREGRIDEGEDALQKKLLLMMIINDG